MTDSFYDNPWGDDNANSDEGKKKSYTEFCISPWGKVTEEILKKRQEQRDKNSGLLLIDLMEQQHKRGQERRNQGQDPGAIPPRNLGSNRFGRGNRGRWNDPRNN